MKQRPRMRGKSQLQQPQGTATTQPVSSGPSAAPPPRLSVSQELPKKHRAPGRAAAAPAAAGSIGTELQLRHAHRPPRPPRCCSHRLQRLQERFRPARPPSGALLLPSQASSAEEAQDHSSSAGSSRRHDGRGRSEESDGGDGAPRKRKGAGSRLTESAIQRFSRGYPSKKTFTTREKKIKIIQVFFKLKKNAALCHGREEGGINVASADDILDLLHPNLSPISKEPAPSGA